MRIFTGDECGLLKEVTISMDSDASTTSLPSSLPVASTALKATVRRIHFEGDIQTRKRGLMYLSSSSSSPSSSAEPLWLAGLRVDGSIDFWREERRKVGPVHILHVSDVFGPTAKGMTQPLPIGMKRLDGGSLSSSSSSSSSSSHRWLCADRSGRVATVSEDGTCVRRRFGGSDKGGSDTRGDGPFFAAMAVHGTMLALGGKDRQVRIYDLASDSELPVWTAKNRPPDRRTQLQRPIWPTAMTFLGESGHLLAIGTAHREVMVYDVRSSSGRRRPVKCIGGEDDVGGRGTKPLFRHRIVSLCPLPPLSTSTSTSTQSSSSSSSSTTTSTVLAVGDAAGRVVAVDPFCGGGYGSGSGTSNAEEGDVARAHLRRYVGPAGSIRNIDTDIGGRYMACVSLDRMLWTYHANSGKTLRPRVYLHQRLNCLTLVEESNDDNEDIDEGNGDVHQPDRVQDYVDSDQDHESNDNEEVDSSDSDSESDSDENYDIDNFDDTDKKLPKRIQEDDDSDESSSIQDEELESESSSEESQDNDSDSASADDDDDDDRNKRNTRRKQTYQAQKKRVRRK